MINDIKGLRLQPLLFVQMVFVFLFQAKTVTANDMGNRKLRSFVFEAKKRSRFMYGGVIDPLCSCRCGYEYRYRRMLRLGVFSNSCSCTSMPEMFAKAGR